MRITLHTAVQQSYRTVFQGFTKDLFLKLAPPFPPIQLLRFDGCQKGDEVHLELNMIFFKQRWDALIIESGELDNELYFIDQGTTLPFFLQTWQHHHRIVQQTDGSSCIIDDFTYTSPFRLMDYLLYPVFYIQFAMRKPIYQEVFSVLE